jgi:hypothetical protein
MKPTLFILALLGSEPVMLVSDRVPDLNYEALCKDATVITTEACMRDETTAHQQLISIWQTTSPSVRNGCESEAVAGGYQSYVDLLTCIQMSGQWKRNKK